MKIMVWLFSVLLLAGAAAAAPAQRGYPGLPALGFGQATNPEVSRQVDAATRATVLQGLWNEHQAAADEALITLTTTSIKFQRSQRIQGVLDDPLAGRLLLQSALIRRLGADALQRTAAREADRPFLEWLFLNPSASGALLSSIKEADDVEKVLAIWARLWRADPEGRDRYHALALACALVFDRPTRTYGRGRVTAEDRYMDFRDQARKGRLKTQIDKLPAWELVWVVDAPVPASELEWARKNINLSRAKWSRAYSMITYRMSKAVNRAQIHDEYTLAKILEVGGTCGDQAYFGAITAKAHGIPAMTIIGHGDRGGHAWFGYKASSREWNLEAGRYTSDNYAAGTTRDPQTGTVLKEHEITLLADEQRRSAQYGRADWLLSLARIFLAHGQPDRAGLALELALAQSSRHEPSWDEYLAFLKAQAPPQAKWDAVLRKYRSAYRKYPDRLVRADALETERLVAAGKMKEAAKSLRQMVRRLDSKSENRTDLIVDHVIKQAKVLEQAGNIDGALSVYRYALKDFGDTTKGFKALSQACFVFAERNDQVTAAVRYIDSAFEKHHPRPTSDYFAMTSHASLMEWVAAYLREADRQSEAERMVRDAAELRRSAKASYGKRR